MTDFVTRSLESGVLTLTLNNGVAHPLSLGMIRSLHDAVRGGEESAAVIVIHGPGKIFCAGHDLKEIAAHRADDDGGEAYLVELFDACAAMMQAVANCRRPT
ncbi:MAG: enoyl-CoA hydratase/isomerase family protein, partial [Paracoccaceae bacterium]